MKAHSLPKLLSSLHNRPHLITAESFNFITEYLTGRNTGIIEMMKPKWKAMDTPVDPDGDGDDDSENVIIDTLGILTVAGSLTYKPYDAGCGEVGTSYQSLVETMGDLAEAGCTTVVMHVDSGGGEAACAFESADAIRDIADGYGIELIGYADLMACSAAYALICVCDEVIINPSSTIGSIGVLTSILDTSKAMADAGYKQIYITSGESKVPYADDGSFKPIFLDELQEEVDRLADQFAAHVSQYTGIPTETIMGFEAKVFNADAAVEAGLANQVMTSKQFADYIAAKTGKENA